MEQDWPTDGPFTAPMSGLSGKALRLRLERGQIRRVCTGTYVSAGEPDTLTLRAAALELVVPPDAVACRGTAAWVHGVDALPSGSHERLPAVELAVPKKGFTALRRQGVKSYVEHLLPDDITFVGRLRVTSPERTATDLGRWLRRQHAIGALDAFLRSGLVTRAELRAAEERWTGYPWVKQLRELVTLADARAESPRESWLRLLLLDAGFPAAVPQLQIDRGPGLAPYRLDLAWPDLLVAVEYDGGSAHGPDRMLADEARRRYIRGLGWSVIVARRGDLERPERLVEAVGQFVAPVRPARPRAKVA